MRRTSSRGLRAHALAALEGAIGSLDRITRIVKVVGFVASAPDFTGQPGVMNGAPSCSARSSATPVASAQRGRCRCPAARRPVEVELIAEFA